MQHRQAKLLTHLFRSLKHGSADQYHKDLQEYGYKNPYMLERNCESIDKNISLLWPKIIPES